MYLKTILLLFILVNIAFSQVVRTEPLGATRLDSFSVIFDASKGDGGLAGYGGDDVYAHTGVTIEGKGDWQYVNADWEDNPPEKKLTRIEGDLWRLNVGYPYEYYTGVQESEIITKLSFVFKDSTQTVTGRGIGGADIFLTLPEPGNLGVILLNHPDPVTLYSDPQRTPLFIDVDSVLDIKSLALPTSYPIINHELFYDGQSVASTTSDTLQYSFDTEYPGMNLFKLLVEDEGGDSTTLEFAVMVKPPVQDETRPESIEEGINYINESTVVLSLFAPYKEFVYLIGDFNYWQVNENYQLKRDMVDANNVWWWIELTGLTPGQEYAFQYLVDGTLRIADPYTTKTLDREDQYISEQTYPGLKEYPVGKTEHATAVFQTNQTVYDWQAKDFTAPAQSELVIYELLVRDFVAAHDFKTLTDTLDYLVNLGINAIELMPVSEFEGNSGWGYNPSFHMALDKYYGPKNDLKRLVDACHERGLAVILDIVLNHAFGQSPFVRLYISGNSPTEENPWLNAAATHPDNVGYDFNHESVYTQRFVDKVNRYWLEEFNIDGYRFDLAKGFMQTGSYHGYNAGRIVLLKRMADKIWEYKNDTYVILENWADNTERSELADYGMMIWGHPNPDKELGYYEAAMGYHENNKSDFSWGYYGTRGWNKPHLVTKIESHDEERLMYKNLRWGNSSGGYSVKDLPTALQRMKAAMAFFFTIPGPKLFWQFMELGYDFSIFSDVNGNVPEPYPTDTYKLWPKPIRWNYFQDPDRRRLYDTFAALLKMRKENPVFRSAETTVNLLVSGVNKRIKLSHPSMDVTIIGNFGLTPSSVNPAFHSTGSWYDFFSGDTLNVSDVTTPISLQPGEFHIYTSEKINSPEVDPVTAILTEDLRSPLTFELNQNYPNPFNPVTTFDYQISKPGKVILKIYDVAGREVKTLVETWQPAGSYSTTFDGSTLSSGIYFYALRAANQYAVRKMILLK